MKNQLLRFYRNSLYRNSIYLMAATAVMAGFGFVFWLITARIFSTENIGLATALISAMNLIAMLSLIGFDMAFVRYLPDSRRRNDKLNTGLILVAIAAILLSILFIAFVNLISPKLGFIKDSPLVALLFIVFCAMSALNILSDSVFLSERETKYTLLINTIFSALKIALPFAFVNYGALGIFAAAAAAQSAGFIMSITVMARKFGYRPKFVIDRDVLKRVWLYSLGNYTAGILNLLPVTLLPLIILNSIGSEQAAYYYIPMMIGNLLYVIPWSATKSLFAEVSNDEGSLKYNINKSIRIISILLLPAIAVFLVGSSRILLIFGKDYLSEGVTFLRLIALTGIAVSSYSIFTSLFRLNKDSRSLIVVNIFYAVTIIGLSYALMPYGLTGIGIAWLSGHIVASIVGVIALQLSRADKFFRATAKIN